jgi:hypothetical protein
MHQHITDCDSESCELPRFVGEGATETKSEAEHVAEVAIKALDTVAELHRQEEETERTEKIVEGALETTRIQADALVELHEKENEPESESESEEIEPITEEEPEQSEEEAEEIAPPGEETTGQPPEQEEKHAEPSEETKEETKPEEKRRHKSFGRR